ncbi:transcriptional coactivator YAP1-like [Paramacrobiotus metropolitanus]|uniref:transcriptional coactivator YAP1-like n=1 Tax=Paramacrobiotus metropolitanus TaxID=2943436 RepID=UPI00244565B1|nr:transcriptional coactivator YAP1-like [Paramacrobiotus metropolitanus]
MAEEGSGSHIITRHEGPNQVIHIREDSNGILDELFKAGVQNPKIQNTVPLRARNLPASFFIQPKTDKPLNPQPCVHMRSHSSPASITQTLSLPPQSSSSSVSQARPPLPQVATPVNNHFRQKSVPVPHSQPQYFPSNLPDGRIIFQNKYTSEVVPDGPRIRDQLFGPLPDGWAELKDDHGETYFVDHTTKTTSWFDPRLPEEVQKSSVYNRQQRGQTLSQQNGFAQNGMFSGATNARPISSNQPVHSPQHSFSQSVNANAIPGHNQRMNFLSSSFTNSAYSQPSAGAAGLSLSHHVQQQSPSQTAVLPQQGHTLYTTELEMEREMLKMRRREIQQQQLHKQQQMNMHLQMGHPLQSPTDASMRRTPGDYDIGSPMSPVASMRQTDPFLGGYHGRQESGDSGFSASTPRTPENYLAQTMDELSLYNEGWDVNAMNVTSGGAATAPALPPQQTSAMDCGPDEFTDYIFNDLESVLGHTDNANSSYTDITWV